MPYSFDGFEWDGWNEGHLDGHRLSLDEVEEVFFNPRYEGSLGEVNGEKRWVTIGPTDSDRILTVVFTIRGRNIRVVTAYDASPKQKAKYRERGQ